MRSVRSVVKVILQVLHGIEQLVVPGQSLAEIEQGVWQLARDASREMLEETLSNLDQELAESRDKSQLRMIHSKARTIVTPMGAGVVQESITPGARFSLRAQPAVAGCADSHNHS